MRFKVYHNPRCGKSRAALKYMDEHNILYDTVIYLKDTPDFNQIKEIIHKLNIKPFDLIRKKEKIFIDSFKNINLSDDEWIKIMVENPILIERPIIFDNKNAVIGRPAEKIAELI